MNNIDIPPPAIDSERVIAYAIADGAVRYNKKQRLYAGERLVGRVPKIAICKSLRKQMSGYLILFCNKRWRVKGVSGAKSLREAKKEVERYYIGIESKWIAVDTSVKTAKQWLAAQYPQDVCSFCGNFSYDARIMFLGPKVAVCSNCVEAFSQELKRKD